MSGRSSAANAVPVHLGPPTLRNFCFKISPQVRQLEKRLHRSNSAARRQIAFRFHKMALRGSRETRNCHSPLKVEFKIADDAQIFNIRIPISLERQKLETSNLVCTPMTMSSFDNMQNTRSKGTWPSLSDLDLNLRNPESISQMAKTTGLKFSMQIDCREWKISSTKVGQKGKLYESQWPTFRCYHFFYISVMTTATDFKFGAHIAYSEYYQGVQK